MAATSTNTRASAGIRDLRKQDKFVNFFHGSHYTNTHPQTTPTDARSQPPPSGSTDCTWVINKTHGSKHRLDPVDFSLWSDAQQDYLMLNQEQASQIIKLYNSNSVSFTPPFLVIATDSPSLPGDDGMITLTVGCAPAIFISLSTDRRDSLTPTAAHRANGLQLVDRHMKDPLLSVYQAISWSPPSPPDAEHVLEILQRFCDVSALNFLWPNIVIELSDSGRHPTSGSLPGVLGRWSVTYHQAIDGRKFWDSKRLGRKRNITPQDNFPRGDDTNYHEKDGIIGPGVRVEGATTATTLGVRLKRGTEVRVTVANHGFIGRERVFHPDEDNGEHIADITERYPDNDWAVARIHPHIAFSNDRIFESTHPTKLMTMEDIKQNEWYTCDGMTTGTVAMMLVGVRYLVGIQDTNSSAPMAQFATASIYYSLGACGDAENDNVLREGICGAPIIHEKTGGVAGFFQFQDQSNCCLAPHLDRLIKEGWEIY